MIAGFNDGGGVLEPNWTISQKEAYRSYQVHPDLDLEANELATLVIEPALEDGKRLVREMNLTIGDDAAFILTDDEGKPLTDERTMKAALDDVASRVKASPGDEHLTIIGHTDSIGTEEYNLGLGQRRADATADYLIDQGISASQITTKSMGESQPVADNGTREGRAKNRRAEILTK